MIKCNHCGAKNENNAKICVVCGKEITNNEKFVDSNRKMPWYGSTWFIILMLFCFWPVSLYLIWKYKPEWVSSDWFTILWLICFAPVGLYLMWKHRKFSNIVRVIVTVVVSVFWIWIFYYGSTRNTDMGIEAKYYKQDSSDSIISTEKTNVDSNRAANEETKAELEKKDGWILEDGYWYYYTNNEREKSKFIEGYYLNDDGKMVTNETIDIEGKKYKFDGEGKYTIVEESSSIAETKQAKKKRGIFDDPDVKMHRFINSMCEQQYNYGYKISGLSVEEISDGVLDGQCRLSIKNSSGVWGEYTLHCVADFNKEKLITWDVR